MTDVARRTLRTGLPVLLVSLLAAVGAAAISVGSTGPAGEINPSVGGATIGPGGDVFELDSFLLVGPPGSATQLSVGSEPGIDVSFSYVLLDGASDLVLTYAIANTAGAATSDVTFFSFLDAEIDEPLNTFFNEFAEASGPLAAGQSFEIDEPGYLFGDIFTHLLAGALDGTNALPDVASADDVSMALSFALGSLAAGETATIDVMISEDGDTIAPFSITQRDADARSTTAITYSGRVRTTAPVIPEPNSALLFGLGLGAAGWFARRTRD